MDSKTAETWVKVIAILGYIGGGLTALGGLIMLLGGSFFGGFLGSLIGLDASFIAGAIAVVGILMIVFGAFWIYVAMNVWRHVNWARVVTIVFCTLGFLGALMSLPTSILSLIIDGGIAYLLWFQKDIVALFK